MATFPAKVWCGDWDMLMDRLGVKYDESFESFKYCQNAQFVGMFCSKLVRR